MARAPQALESPTVRRSRYLAEALQQMRQEPERIGGYGDLGARLLAQGITQYASGKAERAVEEEAQAAQRARASRIAASLGLELPEQPEPEAPRGNFLSRLLRGDQPEPQSQPAPASPMPQPGMQPPMPDPMTQPAAPVGPVGVGELPPAGPPQQPMPQAPQMPQGAVPGVPPQMPQQAPNPLGPSPGERAMLQQWLISGTPEDIARAEALSMDIQMRQAEPAAMRYEYQAVNGVPALVDPVTGELRPIDPSGVPQWARTQDEFNPEGTRAGTLGQRDPSGQLRLIETPPEGFEAEGGRLRPIAGGPQDPAAGGNRITNERNLRQEFQRDTSNYREARNGYNKVLAAANDRSGAGDVALIFGFMKTLDPTSTVREGEFATAQQTGSIPDYIVARYNQALRGERLTDEQRNSFVSTARSQFQTYEEGYQSRLGEYIGMAESYGLDPSNVVGSDAPRRQAPAPAPQRQREQPRPSGRRRRYNPNTGRIE